MISIVLIALLLLAFYCHLSMFIATPLCVSVYVISL